MAGLLAWLGEQAAGCQDLVMVLVVGPTAGHQEGHCCLAALWVKAFLHIGFCNSIRQVYSEIDSMIGYLS